MNIPCHRRLSQPPRAQMQTRNRLQGFTLIELMVVIVIIGILLSYASLAIRGRDQEDLIKEEAQRFDRLVQLALEEATLRGEEYALEIYTDGYRFYRFENNQWTALENDHLLHQRALPDDIEIDMSLEKTDIVIDAVLSKENAKDSDARDSSKQQDNSGKPGEGPKPQIFLLSSGEITPEFDLRFYILGTEASYLVSGRFDGSLSTEPSKL